MPCANPHTCVPALCSCCCRKIAGERRRAAGAGVGVGGCTTCNWRSAYWAEQALKGSRVAARLHSHSGRKDAVHRFLVWLLEGGGGEGRRSGAAQGRSHAPAGVTSRRPRGLGDRQPSGVGAAAAQRDLMRMGSLQVAASPPRAACLSHGPRATRSLSAPSTCPLPEPLAVNRTPYCVALSCSPVQALPCCCP